jgi:hypothetical protein
VSSLWESDLIRVIKRHRTAGRIKRESPGITLLNFSAARFVVRTDFRRDVRPTSPRPRDGVIPPGRTGEFESFRMRRNRTKEITSLVKLFDRQNPCRMRPTICRAVNTGACVDRRKAITGLVDTTIQCLEGRAVKTYRIDRGIGCLYVACAFMRR